MAASVFFSLLLLLFLQTFQAEVLSPNDTNFVDGQEPVIDIAYISCKDWSGKPPKTTTELQNPVNLVIIAHTATNFCATFEKCSKLVRAMQHYHFQTDHSDILYNFLIGGDGNIYEGRGWNVKNASNKQPSISVSFIGNFMKDYLSEEMIAALEKLLIDGVEKKNLTEDYDIVAHNQTVATLSPGVHVYEIIQKLEHFKAGKI